MLVLWGIVIHLIFLLSVFDIYFKSPVIDGISSYAPRGAPPASRLLLFSADGLRAESLLESGNTQFLKHLMEKKGNWGISHTRVPTESRPGHVAIIAGLYEDPSAVAKGWKENPVEFDSLFNRSRHTWSWGSPDILPMFAKGATGNHVDTYYYSHEEEDFSGKMSTSNLDTWVFDKVKTFLMDANNNKELMELLKKDQLIFFLHLLGLDTAGHTHKPHSKEYEKNLKVVDEGVRKTVDLFEEFFGYDGKTAYVFTSDHGMTDWGSHGAGDKHETETPLIVWGAGTPEPDYSNINIRDISKITRKDVRQADICPLMAALIGIPIPVNSVGILPDTYFKSVQLKANGLHSNVRQLLYQFDRKREIIEENAIKQIFHPFNNLTKNKVDSIVHEIDSLMDSNDYEKVVNLCKEMVELCLAGLDYYQNYYQGPLLFCISASFVCWMTWLLTELMKKHIQNRDLNKPPVCRGSNSIVSQMIVDVFINIIFLLLLIVTLVLVYVQNLPVQYYSYFILPIVLWWKQLLDWKVLRDFAPDELHSKMRMFASLLACLVGSYLLVLTFFLRVPLSICLVIICIIQLWCCHGKNVPSVLLALWIFTCIGLAYFPLLPVIGKNTNIHLVGSSGLLWFLGSLLFLSLFSLNFLRSGQETKRENVMLVVPVIMMLIALQNKYFVDFMFNSKKGLPWFNQIISWILLALSFIIPSFSSHWMFSRLFCIMSSLAVFFILLSVKHEGFFLFFLACNLLCWVAIEHYVSRNDSGNRLAVLSFRPKSKQHDAIHPITRNLTYSDVIRSFMFLCYIILSFFGIGNIASINSFDPQWVRCFVSQFSPYLMGGLILCKTFIPFLFVACTFCAVNLVVKAPTGQLFIIVMVISNFMGLLFLHQVKNKGSWLDIGTSISHYVIMETIIVIVSLLYGLGQLMTGTIQLSLSNMFKKRVKVRSD